MTFAHKLAHYFSSSTWFRDRTGTILFHFLEARFSVQVWIENPLAHYNVCEQDNCGGKSGYAYSMPPDPDPTHPLPTS